MATAVCLHIDKFQLICFIAMSSASAAGHPPP
jgi:hypothetical protein